MVHEELVVAQSSVFHRFACSAFSTNEKDFTFARSNLVQFSQSFVEHRYMFFSKVDDAGLSLRAPKMHGFIFGFSVTGLVTEVNTSLEHVAHGNSCHD